MTNTHLVLFDGKQRESLLPLTYTRAVADIRIGILKIHEKWKVTTQATQVDIFSQSYLQDLYSSITTLGVTTYINASLMPSQKALDTIDALTLEQALYDSHGNLLAFKTDESFSNLSELYQHAESLEKRHFTDRTILLSHPWDIFTHNAEEIRADIDRLELKPNGYVLEKDNKVKSPENIYVEEGATAQWAMLDASQGPIYLGKNSLVMENAVIKENFALCEHSTVKIGAKMYGDTTIGPHSKVGGEIGNSVIFGYSNKGHDGYLGNSVLGEWCNLGADTNNSNLKNNYSSVRAWSYSEKGYTDTQLQFCGLIMGDHSKCGINTMFNTGTVVGVFANIYGGGFPPKFIPSFAWGSSDGFVNYDLNKALETAEKVMARRNIELTETDKEILNNIYNQSSNFRNF